MNILNAVSINAHTSLFLSCVLVLVLVTKCKETNRIKILSGEVDALAVRIRNVEIKIDENSKQIMKKTEANVSTPKDHIGYLPYDLPTDFSKSVMSPSNSILRPRNIFTPAQANLEDDERRDHMEEELLKDDGLENISENEIPDEHENDTKHRWTFQKSG